MLTTTASAPRCAHDHGPSAVDHTDNAPSASPLPTFIPQHYGRYTDEAHDVWRTLYTRRMATLEHTASRHFLDGLAVIGLNAARVPELADVNRRLDAITGWNAMGVEGFIPAPQFFRSLAHRRFPTTLMVRPREQLDYLPEPDIFHDVFGHVPLHANPVFADFLQQFGALAADAATEQETMEMARLFWFTVEFGLIRERDETRVYGSGLISSHDDAANALSDRCDRRPFSLDAVIAQPFDIDRLQDVLFVLDDVAQLYDAVDELGRRRAQRPRRGTNA